MLYQEQICTILRRRNPHHIAMIIPYRPISMSYKSSKPKKLPRLSNDGLILRSSLHATVAASSHVRPRKWLRLSRGCAEAPPRPRHRPRSKLSLPTPTYGKFSRRLLVEVEVAAPLSNPWCVVIELLSSFDFVRSQSSLGQDG